MIKHANMLKDDKSYKALNLSKDYVSLFEDGVRSKLETKISTHSCYKTKNTFGGNITYENCTWL